MLMDRRIWTGMLLGLLVALLPFGSAPASASQWDASHVVRGSFTAAVDDELGALTNPAGLIYLKKRGVHFHSGVPADDTQAEAAARKYVAYFEPDQGVGSGVVSYAELDSEARQYAYTVAKRVGGGGSIGASVKLMQAEDERRWSADLGYVQDLGSGVRVGMSWRNAISTASVAPKIDQASPKEVALGLAIGSASNLTLALDYVVDDVGAGFRAGKIRAGGQIRMGAFSTWASVRLGAVRPDERELGFGVGLSGQSVRLDLGYAAIDGDSKLIMLGLSTYF